jgi:hypothetical protein
MPIVGRVSLWLRSLSYALRLVNFTLSENAELYSTIAAFWTQLRKIATWLILPVAYACLKD